MFPSISPVHIATLWPGSPVSRGAGGARWPTFLDLAGRNRTILKIYKKFTIIFSKAYNIILSKRGEGGAGGGATMAACTTVNIGPHETNMGRRFEPHTHTTLVNYKLQGVQRKPGGVGSSCTSRKEFWFFNIECFLYLKLCYSSNNLQRAILWNAFEATIRAPCIYNNYIFIINSIQQFDGMVIQFTTIFQLICRLSLLKNFNMQIKVFEIHNMEKETQNQKQEWKTNLELLNRTSWRIILNESPWIKQTKWCT